MTDTQATHLKCPSFVSIHLKMVKINKKLFLKALINP